MELIPFSSCSSSSSSLSFLSFYCSRGTTINHLPEALLIEIFLRLPLKLAKKCMVVCKYWYNLISTPYFGYHFLQFNYTSTLLFSHEDCSANNKKLFVSRENSIFNSNSFCLSYLPCKPPAAVIASCEDLLLCCPDLRSNSVYYICNPTNRQWIQHSSMPRPLPNNHFKTHTGFIFEGKGISFKYAIVRLPFSLQDMSSRVFKFQIFSSDSGNWIEKVWIRRRNLLGFPLENLAGVPYKGILFWVSYFGNSSYILVGIDPFKSFKPIYQIDLPNSPTNFMRFQTRQVAVCRGRLKLLETVMNDDSDILSIRIWDFKDFTKNEWDLKHHISFFGLQSENPSWFGDDEPFVRPIGCDSNHDGEIIMYIMIEERVVVLCNINKQTLDVINDKEMFRVGSAFVYVLPWQPTEILSHQLQRKYKV